MFTFANQAGLDMLETTLGVLQQDINLEKIFGNRVKSISLEFPNIMQQVFIPLEIC